MINENFLILLARDGSTERYLREVGALGHNPSPSRIWFYKNVLEKLAMWPPSTNGMDSDLVQRERDDSAENTAVGAQDSGSKLTEAA